MEPGQLDLDLSADRAEAGARSIVALHARFQGPGLNVHHREMLVNLDNTACRGRLAICRDDSGDHRFLERHEIAGVKHRSLLRFHVDPDAGTHHHQTEHNQNRAEGPRVGQPQPPNETDGPHHEQQADEAEDEEDEGGAKIHRRGSPSTFSETDMI